MSATHVSSDTPDRRRAAAEHLGALPTVLAVDDVADQPAAATLEVTLVGGLERVPPAVIRAIGEHDHGVGLVQRQGGHWIVEVR
jgi:hypothetical protein